MSPMSHYRACKVLYFSAQRYCDDPFLFAWGLHLSVETGSRSQHGREGRAACRSVGEQARRAGLPRGHGRSFREAP